jgi:hypothetical protein
VEKIAQSKAQAVFGSKLSLALPVEKSGPKCFARAAFF